MHTRLVKKTRFAISNARMCALFWLTAMSCFWGSARRADTIPYRGVPLSIMVLSAVELTYLALARQDDGSPARRGQTVNRRWPLAA